MGVVAGAFAVGVPAQDTGATKKDDVRKADKMERKAFKREGFRGMRGHRGAGFGLRGIDLTDAQKEQLKAIHEANRPDQATMDELKTIKQARRDGTLTDAQKERARAIHESMQQKHEAVRLQIQNILTDEQKQQLEARKLEMQKRREEMKQRRDEMRKKRQEMRQSTEKPATDN
jgi:Spy/CpxP family protein refolding chaperone